MDPLDFARYVGALFVTLALLGVFLVGLRRFGPMLGLARANRRGGPRRLAVEEALMLDARRRLVLVRADGREHLLLLGASGETVVESRPAAPEDDSENGAGE
ncbi:MAG: flagellar biosynthetic protein FliO [Maricaulaceae bacterium]